MTRFAASRAHRLDRRIDARRRQGRQGQGSGTYAAAAGGLKSIFERDEK